MFFFSHRKQRLDILLPRPFILSLFFIETSIHGIDKLLFKKIIILVEKLQRKKKHINEMKRV